MARNLTCDGCGASLEEASGPCSVCGSSTRLQTLSVGGPMRPTNYNLDTYVAHGLSRLTECGAPQIAVHRKWLNQFILTSEFIAPRPSEPYAYLFNFLRRIEAALTSYIQGREALVQHVGTPRTTISHYFAALLHFEVCISQASQGIELLGKNAGIPMLGKRSQQPVARMGRLYIHSKHMDEMISGGKLPPTATSAIWITNQGLECSECALSFVELAQVLREMTWIADRLVAPSGA